MRLLLLAVLALSCCPPDRVTQHGPAPIGSERVLDAASRRCDLRCTEVTWTADPPFQGVSGTVWWDSCGAHIAVWAWPGRAAWDTALAHELGHYCLGDHADEGRADTWAAEVNAEARSEAGF